jgi:hypothetical protein
MDRKLIVTHHAPDLDAITSVWLLKRFDAQHYADAQIAFVNPGEEMSEEEIEQLGHDKKQVTHVDTGLGAFDHHQPERATDTICAATLVYDHCVQVHPELLDDEALKIMVKFVTQIDHFKEIYWHEANDIKYNFMIHELIRGMEFFDPHNDDSQLHFGMTCLDCAYAVVTQRVKAEQIIAQKGQVFKLREGKALALDTRNDDTLKMAQKMGYVLAVRKDTKLGHIRIKVRPDAELDLKPLYDKITQVDQKGTWFYHASGKMLINGSVKHHNQTPSPLPLNEVIALIKEIYA